MSASPSASASASGPGSASEWADREPWLEETLTITAHCKECAAKPMLCIKQAACNQMTEQLRKTLPFRHVARCDRSYGAYTGAVEFLEEVIKVPGIKEPFHMGAFRHFVAEMDAVRAVDKAKAASDKAKVARSMYYPFYEYGSCVDNLIESKKQSKAADEDSGDDDVVVITNPSEDTEMIDASKGLNASMHAPKADSPDAKSIRFRKDKDKKSPKDKKDRLITASSIKSELNKAPKRPRLEHPVVDLREETIEERNSRVIGSASVNKYASLVPFLELEKAPVDVIV
ncbi:hypothetical protein MPER_13198, partial [Moniliophthora perniciosa FA553]